MNRYLYITAIAIAALAGACNTTKSDTRGETAGTGEQPSTGSNAAGVGVMARPSVGTLGSVSKGSAGEAAEFTWTDARGEHKLSDYRGKVVLINFWGTWCPPCRRELPALVKIREELAGGKFEIIGINIGEQPRGDKSIEEHVGEFASTNNIRYPLVIADEEIVDAYGPIEAVPTTFLVDANGKIIERIVGSRDEAGFRALIQKAL